MKTSSANTNSRRRDVMKVTLRGTETDLVDCRVALPGQLFYGTQIPVCLWIFEKNKNAAALRGFRERCERAAAAFAKA